MFSFKNPALTFKDKVTFFLAFLIVPVAILVCIENLFLVLGGLVSYEILVLPILALFIRPIFVGLLYLFYLFSTILFTIAPAYNLTYKSFVLRLSDFLSFPAVSLIIIAIVNLIILLCVVYVSKKVYRTRSYLWVFITTIVIFCCAYFIDKVIEPRMERNIVLSVTNSFIRIYDFEKEREITAPQDLLPAESASQALFDLLESKGRRPKKVMMIIVESLGFGDQQINDLQVNNVFSGTVDETKFDTSIFKVPFKGTTVPSEMRELCQRATLTLAPQIDKKLSETCLPHLFSQQGYTTSAYHGYSGAFFNRIEWYNDLGFDNISFANKLITSFGFNERCGFLFFEGLCDIDIAKHITKRLINEPKPEFIYWLTLNGHQPILGRPNNGTFLECEEMQIESDTTCWTIQHGQVALNSIIEIANKVDDIAIVLVGDHIPGGEHKRMSNDYVPAVIMWPKDLERK